MKEKNYDLSAVWTEEISMFPEVESILEIKIYYLYFVRKELCSGRRYSMEYIGNKHPNRNIIATVETASVYVGRVVNRSTKKILVKPGEVNEIKLGCTGFDGGTTSPDTEHFRRIIDADWENPIE